MAIPQQRVDTKLTLTGEDQASKAIRGAKRELQDFVGAGNRAGKDFGQSAKHIQETSGDVESALKSLTDFLPGLSDELSLAGDAGGALEAMLRLIPGPAGLVAVGLTAAGAAAVYFGTKSREAAAQLRLLGDANTAGLAERFDLDIRATAALQSELAKLPGTLRPSEALLDQVARRARAIGEDGGKAVAALVSALAQGGDAVAAFERQFGRLPVAVGDLAAQARSAGIDPELLGVGPKAQTAIGKTQELLSSLAVARAEFAVASRKEDAAEIASREAVGTVNRAVAEAERTAAARAAYERFQAVDQLQRQVEAQGRLLEAQRAASAELAASDRELKQIARIEDERVRNAQTVLALQTRQETLQRQLLALEEQRAGLGDPAYQAERDRLTDLIDQAKDGVTAAFKAGDEFDKRREDQRKQRADAARQRRDRERARDLAEQRAQVQLWAAELEVGITGPEEEARARIRAMTLQANAEKVAILQDVNKSLAERSALVRAVDLKLQRQVSDADKAASERRIQLERELDDARAAGADAGLQRELDAATERGDLEAAAALRIQQIRREEAAALLDIERELQDARKTLYGEDLALAEQTAREKAAAVRAAAAAQSADVERDRERQQLQADAERIAAAAERPLDALQGVGGRSAAAMAAASRGVSGLARSWQDAEKRSSGIIGAVGDVAAAVVDGEREKAGVLAAMEFAQSVALSFVPGKQAEAAGHATAAAVYGLVAGGVLGSSASSPASSGAAGGGGGGQSGQGGGGQQGYSGPEVLVVNYGLLGTPHEAALAGQRLLSTLGNTGYRRRSA